MPSYINWDNITVRPRTETIEGIGKFKTSGFPVLSDSTLASIQSNWIGNTGTTIHYDYIRHFSDFFFAQFYPFISNAFYSGMEPDLIEGGPNISRNSFFDKRLIEALVTWSTTLDATQLSQLQSFVLPEERVMVYVNNFANFLEESSNAAIQRLRIIQENVIFYCLDRLIDTMKQTQETQYRYSLDTIKYYLSMQNAQTGLESIDLPAVQQSAVDGRIPDPESVGAQQAALLEREKKKQAFNLSKDRSRQIETNLQFAQENTKQFQSTFLSLFERQKTVLEVLLRF
ncbi:hypothetical protein [Candidatus Similichlamydia laticola]|uniref:Uncharacterized protein n=1 Tax=Candidatus Similichlamydia laticola TaxID=2170265 RepID=A0A369KJ45_9BACT|nr:hypothetical protein [Candidatus Similichlamydia laticola]RDB31803.1 hypothetical protein HAT2_00088 [Candidatus Similichlamydia laticola]